MRGLAPEMYDGGIQAIDRSCNGDVELARECVRRAHQQHGRNYFARIENPAGFWRWFFTAGHAVVQYLRPAVASNPAPVVAAPAVSPPAASGPEWGQVKAALRELLSPEGYANWIEDTRQIGRAGDTLAVWAPDACTLDFLLYDYADAIAESAAAAGLRVVFTLKTGADAKPDASEGETPRPGPSAPLPRAEPAGIEGLSGGPPSERAAAAETGGLDPGPQSRPENARKRPPGEDAESPPARAPDDAAVLSRVWDDVARRRGQAQAGPTSPPGPRGGMRLLSDVLKGRR